MKPVLVGELNPYSDDPRRALAPLPRNAAGDRLRRILRLTDRQYLRAFARVNLCVGSWDRDAAERRATEVGAGSAPLVLLGRKVADAFGVPYSPFRRSGRVLCLPHPSGRCLAWNDPAAHARARRALRRLLRYCESQRALASK